MKHKKRTGRRLKITLMVVAVLLIAGVVVIPRVTRTVKDKAAEAIVKSTMNELGGGLDTADQEKVTEIYENMDEEDQETVREIVSDKLTTENIAEASKYLADGDREGLEAYAKEQLSEEDMAEMKALYEKYADQLQ